MRTARHQRFGEWGILALLSFSILWKGGKSLEATWLLALLACVLTLSHWLFHDERKEKMKRTEQPGIIRKEMPQSVWMVGLAFVAWTALSFLFSTTRNYGLDEVLRTASYVLIFFWVTRKSGIHGDESFARRFATVITAAAVAASIIGIAIYTLQPVSRFVGTFFDHRFHTDYWPNAWAQFLLIAWPMVLFAATQAQTTKRVMLMLGALSLVLSSLALSYSRGGMIAFAGQLALTAFLYGSIVVTDIRYRRMMRSIAASVVTRGCAVVALAAVVFFGVNALRSLTFDVQSVTDKVTFTSAEGTSSIDERAQFWNQSIHMTTERPLFGWGPYSFRFVQPRYMQDVLATSDHPHNVFLKLASERGIPAAILFIAILMIALVPALIFHFMQRRSATRDADIRTILFIVAVAGPIAHNVIDYNLQFVGVGLAFWVCLGLLMRGEIVDNANVGASFRRWKMNRLLSGTEGLLTIALLLVTLWEGGMLVLSSFGRHAQAAGDDRAAMTWYGRSHYSLFTRDLHLSEAQIEMRAGNIPEATDALDRYQRLNAEDPRLWKLKGMLATRQNNPREALLHLKRAFDTGRYTDLGMVSLYLDAQRRSFDRIDEAGKLTYDAIFSDYATAIERNTHFIALSQNVEELQAVARLLSAAFPTDEERYKTIMRRAVAHAQKEREIYEARSPGILW